MKSIVKGVETMEYRELAEEFCQMHMMRKKKMTSVEETMPAQGEARVLFYLHHQEAEVLAGEISRNMMLSASRVTNILNSLEKKGLIRKRNDESDRRKVYISLTAGGREDICHKRRELIKRYENIFREFGMENARMFLDLTKKFSALEDEEMRQHPLER